MADLWPWLTLAGLGALHGLNPTTGWMFAAAGGLQVREGACGQAYARQALLPIAIGHAASIAIVACAFAQGLSMPRAQVQGLAGVLILGAVGFRLLRGAGQRTLVGVPLHQRGGQAGIALWSFLMTTAHGAGLMLVPALVPLCLTDNPARAITASGSLLLALAAVGVHTAAMLATTGLVATGVCRGIAMRPRLLNSAALPRMWTAVLAVTGLLLIAVR
jgi:hypothetical protein